MGSVYNALFISVLFIHFMLPVVSVIDTNVEAEVVASGGQCSKFCLNSNIIEV